MFARVDVPNSAKPVSLCLYVCVLGGLACLCGLEVFVYQAHFSSCCNSLLAQQEVVDLSLFLLPWCNIGCTSVNFDKLSRSV